MSFCSCYAVAVRPITGARFRMPPVPLGMSNSMTNLYSTSTVDIMFSCFYSTAVEQLFIASCLLD